ncbi:hypothetical protein HKCCE3408_13240 [Rhodobacterales bacterium HKCCE3408]|nr:hypothetical protein [Rhodobacterales bacterium HKCCE3408]
MADMIAARTDTQRFLIWGFWTFWGLVFAMAPYAFFIFLLSPLYWLVPLLGLILLFRLGFRCRTRLVWWQVALGGVVLVTAVYLVAAYLSWFPPVDPDGGSFYANGTVLKEDGVLSEAGLRTYYVQLPLVIATIGLVAVAIAWLRAFGAVASIRLGPAD